MIVDLYRADKNVGTKFAEFVINANKAVYNKDDDFVMLIVGTTGTGKSNLGLWVQDLVVPEPRIEQIALTRADLARAIDAELEAPSSNRYIQYDEGKLSRRDWASEWSKELLELYHDVRGLNIFHVWCTAMPNLLDREFIKSRVGCLVYIYTKEIDRPRHFLLLTKNDLLKFLDQNDSISMDLLKKYGKSHASMQSWFKEYHGPMRAAYMDKKSARMRERVKEFAKKWGGDEMSQKQAADHLGIGSERVSAWLKDEYFKPGVDFVVNGTGVRKVTPEGLLSLEKYQKIKQTEGVKAHSLKKRRAIWHIPEYSNARDKEGVISVSEDDEAVLSKSGGI